MENTTTRPTFLTVLCILTFIGSGLGLIGNLLMLVGASFLSSILGDIPDMTALIVIGILGNVACLYGAMQMWKLKKMGFYAYVGGAVIPLVATLILFPAGAGVVGIAISVAWIAMYYMNMKHMS